MADADIQGMLVRIEATTAGLRRELDLGDNRVKKFADNTNRAGSSVDGAFSGMASSAMRLLAPLASAVSAFEALGKAVEVQRQFDVLNAGLITATGSSANAAVAFQALQKFAAQTPYSLDQAVEGFTKLVNLGLTPSEAALNSYGNTASAMGKDLNQMIEAVADAATGEFERLKEFGITSSQQGDKVSLTFRGVTSTIGKNAKEIEGYLLNLGNTDFAGAMDQRAKTLDGAISNLGDTWDTTFRLINERGLGDLMKESVDIAADALQDLNDSIASGQFEAYLDAIGGKFTGFTGDVAESLRILDAQFGEFFASLGPQAESTTALLVGAFRDFPENVRAFIQLMTVEVLAGFDKAQAYAVAFKDSVKAVFTDDTLDQVGTRLAGSLDVINQAREGSIEQILSERDTAVASYKQQSAAADERLQKYRQERDVALATGGDVLAQFGKQTSATNANTAASKELEAQKKREAKALTDLKAQADIAIASATGLAAAYLAGTDKSRNFTLQQKVEEALLKTGAGARDAVTKAINDQQDAQDKLAVSKSAYDLGKETTDLIDQAKATLMGADALAAYNTQKALTIALAGKNVEVGSKEYSQLVAANEAQQQAIKLAQQAGSASGIMDRLYPAAKLLKDYTEDQKALNAAMAIYPEHSAEYQTALVQLGKEYEVNQSKATIWGQLTEGAVDRIDGVFADAWSNIGSGADSLWDNLVKGAKQAFGEIAHMLTTKPLLASISNWLTGTDNGQGLSSVWGKLLGTATGQASGSSSGGLGGLASIGKSIYSAYSAITGVGSSIATGYASGGLSGAVSGGIGYYSSMLSSLGTSLSSGFTSLTTALGLQTAATTAGTAAATTGYGVGSALVSGTAGSATYAAGAGASTGIAAGLSSAASSAAAYWPLAVIAGMYESGKLYDQGVRYDTKQVNNLDVVKYDPLAQASLSGLGLTDKIASKVIGGKLAAIFSGSTFASAMLGALNSKLFGGSWETKNGGISLGVTGGDFDAQQYIDQKKKGGLFHSNKKRTQYSALDADTEDALGSTYNSKVLDSLALFSQLGVQLSDSVLDGLNVAATKISTQGKTTEAIQAEIDAWFTTLGDSAVAAINTATNAGLDGYTFDGVKAFINNLYVVNSALDKFGVKALGISVSGGKAVEAMATIAGGMDALNTAMSAYYDGFTSDIQKTTDSLAAARAQFSQFGFELPDTEEGFKAVMKSLDLTTEVGQNMFVELTRHAADAVTAYNILKQRQEDYYSGFYSESENTARTIKDTTDQIKALGVTLPGTREEFRAMVEAAAKDTSASGKAMYEALMSVAGLAGTAFSAIEGQANTAAQALSDALNSAVNNSFSALQRSISAQQKALTTAYNSRVTSLNDMLSTASTSVSDLTSLSTSLTNALKSLSGTSDETIKMLRAQAQATLQGALATAKAGGSLANFSGLDNALDTVSNNNTDLYTSLEEFNRDQGRTANVVAELNLLNGKQLTSAERSVKTLQDQLDQAKKSYDAEMAQYDAQLAYAQSQLDALNGVDNSILGVTAAINAMNAAVVAALGGKASSGAGSAAANTPGNNATLVDTLYQQLFGRTASSGENKYWADRLTSGNLPYNEIVANMTQYASAADKAAMAALQGHAAGGYISGPGTGTSDSIIRRLSNGEYVMTAAAVRAFGTDTLDQMNSLQIPAFAAGGPVLDISSPSQVFSANRASTTTDPGGSNQQLVSQVRELIDVVKQVVGPMKIDSSKSRKLFEKWDTEGLPETTTASADA